MPHITLKDKPPKQAGGKRTGQSRPTISGGGRKWERPEAGPQEVGAAGSRGGRKRRQQEGSAGPKARGRVRLEEPQEK